MGITNNGQQKDEKVHSRCAEVTPGRKDACGDGDGRKKGEVDRGGLARLRRG